MKEFIGKSGGIILTIGVICVVLFANFGGSSGGGYNSNGDDYDYQDSDPIYETTSDNWNCTDDCSGHEAGYEWAADNGISDPYDCGGNSESFIEGCEAYANEQRIELQEEAEYDPGDYDYGY